ncbi:MAG: alanine--tRNA ligase [Alphaproteobacteria bacterium 41-28]|nr:MAG: alanine--tRNA ligase [Alphaproteobacteria bacterium 41-28]
MQTTADIRSFFLEYFQNRGHTVVPSSPLVPLNDPTLLFTNAGMVQFKNVFTGQETLPFVKAASAQKCIRAGGKHNDLENVGHTARHHTFFEMLGNFSFGDYFKDEAIKLAWTLITKEWGIPAEKLTVTVYIDDDEAATLWRKISGLPADKIIRIASKEENYWSMGDTGPSGPCSEIFYDYGPHIPGGPPGSPEAEGDRFVEIWNLVFMQYEQLGPDEIIPLPKPSVDTGMGIERLAAVLQGVHDNFDTDIFKALIEASEEITKTQATGPRRDSHRVIADHLRSSCFLMADGVLPSNEGRGYVLRRILRRAMRHVQLLGYKGSLMAKLVPTLEEKMGRAYPELVRATPLIVETLNHEEERFRQTLEKGLKLLSEESQKVKDLLPGEIAFKLYDTYGFPLDLTQDVLRGEGKSVDTRGFQQAMDRQKAEARAAWAGSGESKTDRIWFELRDKLNATEFLGYETTIAEGVIEALVKDGNPIDHVKAGDKLILLANQTPFYGESGGQMGDTGVISSPTGKMTIEDTHRKLGDLIVHFGRVVEGELKVGDVVHLSVDAERRTLLRANHSATHLLHRALRKTLGAHVIQKGSLVAPDRLRFDFSHPKALTVEEIQIIEREVNDQVRQNTPVNVCLMTPEEATKGGALALFGEKYGEEVRVVSMGEDIEEPFSVELCGGTHVSRTGDIGYFKFISESGIAAGIRRIEALTGRMAEDFATSQQKLVAGLADQLKIIPSSVGEKIGQLLDERKTLEREVQSLRQRLATSGGGETQKPEMINGVAFFKRHLKDIPPQDLKSIVDQLREEYKSGIFAVVSENEGKVSLVIGVTPDLLSKFDAVDLIRKVVPAIGGKGGGGRPDLAQAGGSDAAGTGKLFGELVAEIERK